jgi:NAD(P)-dependent dehydrogenase (short-subunit alcohol dehydrogenase family)
MAGGLIDDNVLERFKLTDRVAVVTGGARALGRQHALALAEAGARVAICDLLTEDGESTRAQLEALGRPAFFEQADVADAAQIDRFLRDVEEALGPIDILVNNAARPSEGVALETVGDELWQEIMDVNLSSAFYVGKRVAQRMIERGDGGVIINIASINASVISNILPRHNVTYCVAKAGMAQLTRGMAAEWAGYGIRVNALAPGYILTPQTAASASMSEVRERIIASTPMKRYGNLDELKGAIVFLASSASSYMTGSVLYIDGGFTVW